MGWQNFDSKARANSKGVGVFSDWLFSQTERLIFFMNFPTTRHLFFRYFPEFWFFWKEVFKFPFSRFVWKWCFFTSFTKCIFQQSRRCKSQFFSLPNALVYFQLILLYCRIFFMITWKRFSVTGYCTRKFWTERRLLKRF